MNERRRDPTPPAWPPEETPVPPEAPDGLLVVLLLVAVIAAVLLGALTGCDRPSPVEVRGSCGGCVPAAVLEVPPGPDEVRGALDAGRDDAAALAGVRSAKADPAVDWRLCAFVASSSVWGSDVCCDGLCDFPRAIVVALWRGREQTLRLVRWEATAWHLLAVGREDLARAFVREVAERAGVRLSVRL